MSTRLLVFEDSVYRRDGDAVTTDRAFLHYVTRLAGPDLRLRLLGRVDPAPGRSHYEVPADVELVALPHYPTLVHPAAVPALARSVVRCWRALGQVDVAWLMGPHPLSVVLLLLARLRGVPVVLGVRQDLPAYARERHPGRRWAHAAADLLESLWRRGGRTSSVVAVGPQLARHYAGAARLLPLDICLVPATALTAGGPARDYGGPLTLLSVGRLESEKNPLLLADVLALLRAEDPRWRLRVCGEGSLEPALRARLAELGVLDATDLLGYVPVDRGLLDLYRASSVFLHVSWTEGLPQVLFEAWSTGLPVVATAVGGVPEAADGAAVLVPPGDAAAAADAVRGLLRDDALRARLVDAGRARVVTGGMDDGIGRLAAFLRQAAAGAQ